jgi:hypothetical protein
MAVPYSPLFHYLCNLYFVLQAVKMKTDVKVKVKQSLYRPGKACRVPGV